MSRAILFIFITFIFLGCFGQPSTPNANKTQNSNNEYFQIPITLFGQDIKGYALKNEIKIIQKRCDSDTYSSKYTLNEDARYLVFDDGKELSCDVLLPKKISILDFKMLSDYAKEEYAEQSNENKGFLSFLLLKEPQNQRKKTNERPVGFGMIELKADVSGKIVSKKERFDYRDGIVPEIANPFGNSLVDEFKIYVKKFYFDENSRMSSFKKYFLNASVMIYTIDTNNYDFVRRSVLNTLKTRQNEYKNKDLLDEIKIENPRLYKELSSYMDEFILPKSANKKQKSDDYKLKISDEEVNYKIKKDSEQGILDFAQ